MALFPRRADAEDGTDGWRLAFIRRWGLLRLVRVPDALAVLGRLCRPPVPSEPSAGEAARDRLLGDIACRAAMTDRVAHSGGLVERKGRRMSREWEPEELIAAWTCRARLRPAGGFVAACPCRRARRYFDEDDFLVEPPGLREISPGILELTYR